MTTDIADSVAAVNDDVAAVSKQVLAALGHSNDWVVPDGYPHSLALSALDSVFSLRANYASTTAVVNRYCGARRAAGQDPQRDGARELIETMDAAGGPTAASAVLFENHSVAPGTARSGRTPVLKSEALYEAMTSFVKAGVDSIEDLHGSLALARGAWRGVRGLGVVSWDYLLMNTGIDTVKADTMLRRFVATAIGQPDVSVDRARSAVSGAAAALDAKERALDHAIWQYQRRKGIGE